MRPKPGAPHLGHSRSRRLASFHASARSTRMRVGLRCARMSAMTIASPVLRAARLAVHRRHDVVEGREILHRPARIACSRSRTRRTRESPARRPPTARRDRPALKRNSRQLVRWVASVSTDPDAALAVDEGHDLHAARHQRHAVDRPIAALARQRAVDVERAERQLGLDQAGLDQGVGPRDLAREGAERVGVDLRRTTISAPSTRRNGGAIARSLAWMVARPMRVANRDARPTGMARRR